MDRACALTSCFRKFSSLFLKLVLVLFRLTSLKMSWDSYIDNLIAQSMDTRGGLHVSKACIIGLDGGGKWTTDGHANAFKVSMKQVVRDTCS